MESSVVPPNVDPKHQAINAIQGYEFQILNAALEWVDIEENGLIYLEVAEDYAKVVSDKVQVKQTRGSGSITLNTPSVRKAIDSFLDLVEQNPNSDIHLRYLTTSPIGLERCRNDRPNGFPGLKYWHLARMKQDVAPLREILERASSSEVLQKFCKCRTDEELRNDLFNKITWDCDRQGNTHLRQELNERTKDFIKHNFEVSDEESQFAEVLVSHVLCRCACKNIQDRILTHRELHELAEYCTKSSRRIPDDEQKIKTAMVALIQTTIGQEIISTGGLKNPSWIVDVSSLPVPKAIIHRESIKTLIQKALRSTGLCFIVGLTGTGKSILARSVAKEFPYSQRWVDIHDTDILEARNRLKQIFAMVAKLGPGTLILEDLNGLADPRVQLGLSEVVEAAHRHDLLIVVTSYKHPPPSLLNTIGTDSSCVVQVPNFSENETEELVMTIGGDSKTWGRVAYVAGGGGHPQLTYAFIAGMAARNWPREEIPELLTKGLTNTDVEDELSAARTNLIDSLPKSTRELLYRLSITISPFQRSLALEIGALQPTIDNANESFDEMVDRWLEPALENRYRTSPLVRGLGEKMLQTTHQREVHAKIASALSNKNPVDVSEFETILVHGLQGESKDSLLRISQAIVMADEQQRQTMAKYLTVFLIFDTTKPVYPKDLPTSVMLRLAQLRLVVVTQKRENVADIVNALLAETNSVPKGPERTDLEISVLGSILNNPGIANDLSIWVSLLSRFRQISRETLEMTAESASEVSITAALFSIGVAGLNSVERLESVLDDLVQLEDDERLEFLTPIVSNFDDYYLLVNNPLNADARRPDFSAKDAVTRYKRIVSTTESWNIPSLSLQCRVAIARIMVEHLADISGAVNVIHEAQRIFGSGPILARELGRIHRDNGQQLEALRHFSEAVDQMTAFGPVESVYMVREAAICAAKCEEWNRSRDWFLQAQATGNRFDALDQGAFRVGLGVDAAIASFRAGDLPGALKLLKESLQSLKQIEPNLNLQAAHCHRVTRHTILWLRAQALESNTMIEGKPISVMPGDCSNPDPVPAIKTLPLGDIDFAWYMLAEIEISSGSDVGIYLVVKEFGTRGWIPLYEHTLRTQLLGTAIVAQDPAAFCEHFSDYLESASYFINNQDEIRSCFNVLKPERVHFPPLPKTGPYDQVTEDAAKETILSFGMHSVFNGNADAINRLHDELILNFGTSHAGKSIFEYLDVTSKENKDTNDKIVAILQDLLRQRVVHPSLLFEAGIILPQWITKSLFRSILIPYLKPWLIREWNRVLVSQRFLLRSPKLCIPQIRAALNSELENERFAANLSLAAESAFGAHLTSDIRQALNRIVEGS